MKKNRYVLWLMLAVLAAAARAGAAAAARWAACSCKASTASLQALAARGVNELHVEAGHRLNGALLQAGLVDELLLYLAPKLLGPGRGMADMVPLAALSEGVELEWRDLQHVGPDLRILARVAGHNQF